MNHSEDNARTFGLIAISTSIHVFLFVALGFAPSPGEALMRHALEFEVLEKKKWTPTEIEKEEEQQQEKPKEKKQRTPRSPRAKLPKPDLPKESPPPEQTPPQEQQEELVDFSGVTLTSQDGISSWSTVVGDGSEIRKPVVIPKNVKNDSNRSTNVPLIDQIRERIVSAKDLSRPPVPPDLSQVNQMLVNNYPKQARTQGIEGLAIVRARIMSSGRVGQIEIIKETFAGFGSACKKTLKSTRWRPGLDKNGRSATTEIKYTCRFEVEY